MKLEDLRPGASVQGILPNGLVTVIEVQWHGSDTVELIYRNGAGVVDTELLFRDDEARLAIVTEGLPWRFDADGHLLQIGRAHV